MLATRLANDFPIGRGRIRRGQCAGVIHCYQLLSGRPMARWLGTLGKFRNRTKTGMTLG